ncbi:pantoate--beta-alanine ligase [Psychrobacter cryohalolentis]|uniref:Pantothenate synthetase n=1 Tax=Psychrobacter cryohalolentis (strain ATCC BAA-1226 / DSM 17306 / VKM B-2378 / K5) TaxID=335284 RepID=PANC_PSYCK|nr:pantoate--beta-alanine ligase [Psychrobacter cryohalolentis]Q1QEJ3.1 RecName: Full=Pantothenate synthetase; Short=PS; AltName: Full=Pantoate--beta-alanine ligase; AltName: Full=Pantoate-activating enzyme [Psychrobacter cryohalolentis K5]ABE73910.1 pantothenate synthetase [Psychrobacter cryohalolentis K5]ASE26548.1 pantoate--beta-alanine ligase [Psychrobacter cryohalolentis]
MPTIHYHISDLRVALRPYRTAQRIALVPTMGNLHDGHLELVKIAKQHADIVVVSIFVNPTQFGVGEDFDSYPRTLDEDVAKLAMVGADYVFAPTIDEMYPVLPPPTTILAGTITEQLCGKTRPNHFDGVGIVVSKLFNIVQPNIAVFGQKDYQQLAIIKQLVRDLSYSIDIIGAPIIRATDGLALSSRNQYLSESERQTAPILQQELQYSAKQISDNKQPLEVLLTAAHERITSAGFIIDYLEVKTTELTAVDDESINNHQDLVILVAAWLGRARLLDNRLVTINKV